MKFSDYFSAYLDRKGIKKVFISRMLGISYSTLRTKLSRDTFNYSEVLFLDNYYDDLHFVVKYNDYLFEVKNMKKVAK